MTDAPNPQPLTPEEALAAIRDTSPDVHNAEEGNYCFWCGAEWRYWPHPTMKHAYDCIYLRAITPASAATDAAKE